MSKRVAYFGTQGGGIPGHSFTAIIGEFSYEEEREVIRFCLLYTSDAADE